MSKKTDGEVVKPTGVSKVEPQTYFIQKTIGNDTWLVMAQSQIELEDEFSSLYYTAQNQSNIFLQPPFEPEVLLNLVLTNNTLNQCVEAMEVNCDATGHDFVAFDDDTDVDDDEKEEAKAFFEQPYPGLSFIPIRRKLRQQMESIGYGYLEILRNLAGDVVALRNIETHNVRMVKLDEPVMVEKVVTRNGQDIPLKLWVRERRFAQRVALKTLVYYKEFGATRDVDRNTGKWATDEQPIALSNRGTELLIFGIHPDTRTPYFVPRWINEMPSVVGSRKAEEQNLQFLDSGGMPPAIIFVQGGTLAKDTSDQLRTYLSGQNKNKNRAVVVEAQSSSGSLDSAGTVQVKVERFGAERAQDAMYMKYDALTEEHVRVGFRIPPLFLGKPADYNFATAQTAYMVAEAQVFAPERNAFDEQINMTLMKAFGYKTIKFKSNPITLKDIDNTAGTLTAAKDLATRKSLLAEINKLTGWELELAPEPQPDSVSATFGGAAGSPGVDANGQPLPATMTNGGRPLPIPPEQDATKVPALPPPNRGEAVKPAFQQGPPITALPAGSPAMPKNGPGVPKPNANTPKSKQPKKATELIELAQDYAKAKGLVYKIEGSPDRVLALKSEIENLTREDLQAFNSLLATYTFNSNEPSLIAIAGNTH